jgi:hypothetical protein
VTGHPTYPIPHPHDGDDPRFCLSLAIDISEILTRYGYPPITAADFVYWQQRLFTTIYQEKR